MRENCLMLCSNCFLLLLVGLPIRPKSPLDPRKDGEATSYSVLPFSDCPEVSTNNRPQVSVIKFKQNA